MKIAELPPHPLGNPIGDRLLIIAFENTKVLSKEKDREGQPLLVAPESAVELPFVGYVISVGRGRRLEGGTFETVSVSAGDFVLFGKYSGVELNYGLVGKFRLLREEEVSMILTKEDVRTMNVVVPEGWKFVLD